MARTWRRFLCRALPAALLLSAPAWAHRGHGDKVHPGLRNATVLIVRHAEKPDSGNGLSPRGQQRAEAYAGYFDPLRLDGETLLPGRLIASRDSRSSERPRLTLAPLSRHLQLPVEQAWADDQVDQLARSLRKENQAPVVLIAWHHGHIDKLIHAFGGDTGNITGHKSWPGGVYDWLVVLHFDDRGRLVPSRSTLVQEHLLPGDGSGATGG